MLATADDMRARYTEQVMVELADAACWSDAVVAAIDVRLATASAIVEGYVAKYYAPAPERTVPPLLVELTCEIAFAKLHRAPPETVEKREAAAMRTLEKISTGLVKIDGGAQDLPSRPGAVIVPDRQRTFSRDSLGGF
ncbi:MAG: phage protein Gp36 family protein [Sphingobium sp.]